MHLNFASIPTITPFLTFAVCFVYNTFFYPLPFLCVFVALPVSASDVPLPSLSPPSPVPLLLSADTQTTHGKVDQLHSALTEKKKTVCRYSPPRRSWL